MNQAAIKQWPELGYSQEVTESWEVGPSEKYTRILDRALELVESVPYDVTLRWLFYGLWQEGYFSFQKPSDKKSAKALAYGNFSKVLSRLRHSDASFFEKWPINLADDRRDPIHFSRWHMTDQEWLDWQIEHTTCLIDKMSNQDAYVMIAFEAEAMQSQFLHYTREYGASLWPFSGAASIPYKKRMARHIDAVTEDFGLPVILLYFGDLDPAGESIPETAFRHVRKWAEHDFDAFRVGLNRNHIERYDITEDPEKPGRFQWEAVSDRAAAEIIRGALNTVLRRDAIREILEQEKAATEKARAALAEVEL